MTTNRRVTARLDGAEAPAAAPLLRRPAPVLPAVPVEPTALATPLP